MNKILVLSPHPDDETLGCGGTLLKYKRLGWKIDILFFTEMNKNTYAQKVIENRKKELNKLKNFYKFKNIYNFNYETTKMDQVSDSELIAKITKILNKSKPNKIYFPSEFDIHSDHNKITRCFLSCIKPFRNNFLKEVFAYETLSETNFNFKSSFKPNYFEDISKYIKKKIQIAKVFKSEIKRHPFPRSEDSIISLAKLRGSQANFFYAEAFELYFSRSE